MNQQPTSGPSAHLAMQFCTVTEPLGLIKRAQPTRRSANLGGLNQGDRVFFMGIVVGEPVNGNSHWGHYKDGALEYYFWMGGTDWG